IALGFPSPFAAGVCRGASQAGLTEVQQAVALKPTAIIEWLGNNDVLVPALIGQLQAFTSPDIVNNFSAQFNSDLAALFEQLGSTGAPILAATIPDVTEIAYFTPLSVLAAQAHLPEIAVANKLGVNEGDLLRPTDCKKYSYPRGTRASPLELP